MTYVIICGIIISLIVGIFLGRNYFRPTASFHERENKMMEEARRKAEEKVKNFVAQNDNYIKALKAQNSEVILNIRKASETEIALLRHQADVERQMIANEVSALLNEKSRLEELLSQLKGEISDYEKTVIQTKIRILQKFKAERELELERLTADYDKKTAEVVSAIELIQSKLNE
jgi:hypothetical protein